MRAWALGFGVGLALAGTAQGQELRAEMYLITPEAMNKPIGLVLISSTEAGAKFVADLQGLPPGRHGLHVTRTATAAPAQPTMARAPPGWRLASTTIPSAPALMLGPMVRGIWVTYRS